MANVSMIDTVYQTVLALANKEQRGYITPQEFNLFANYAQNEIFEQYFYDLNQFKRIPNNNKNYLADNSDFIEQKLAHFRSTYHSNTTAASSESYAVAAISPSAYRVESVRVSPFENPDYQNNHPFYEAEKMSNQEEAENAMLGPLTRPTPKMPIYFHRGSHIYIYPKEHVKKVKITSISEPAPPNWTYIVMDGKPLFNPQSSAGYMDFQLHPSEQENLIRKILKLAGLSIKSQEVVQVSASEEMKNIQQEKL